MGTRVLTWFYNEPEYWTICTLLGSGSGSNGGDIPNDPGKMFIGGLSWQTTPESIREYFSIFGELAEVMVMKDPATRCVRQFLDIAVQVSIYVFIF